MILLYYAIVDNSVAIIHDEKGVWGGGRRMRVDRLVSLIMILLEKERVGAQELAEMFEVSPHGHDQYGWDSGLFHFGSGRRL